MKVEKYVERRDRCEVVRFNEPADAGEIAALFGADFYSVDLVNGGLLLSSLRTGGSTTTVKGPRNPSNDLILNRGDFILVAQTPRGLVPTEVVPWEDFREKWQKAEGD